MPFGIQASEPLGRAILHTELQLLLDLLQSVSLFLGCGDREIGRRHPLQCRSGTVDLPDFFEADAPDRGSFKRLNIDELFGGKSLECLTDFQAASARFANDVNFDKTLLRRELAPANALANPVGELNARWGRSGLESQFHDVPPKTNKLHAPGLSTKS